MMDKVQLLGAAGAAATLTSPNKTIDGGLYVWDYVCSNWNGATIALQVQGPDLATFFQIGNPAGANGSQGPFSMGEPSIAKVVVTGTPSANIYASLTRYHGGGAI